MVSDWNGIEQVPGCTKWHCPQAINAGIDLVMVPDDWKKFIPATIADVRAGRIKMSRIDDAVSRIVRVKLGRACSTFRPRQARTPSRRRCISRRCVRSRAKPCANRSCS